MKKGADLPRGTGKFCTWSLRGGGPAIFLVSLHVPGILKNKRQRRPKFPEGKRDTRPKTNAAKPVPNMFAHHCHRICWSGFLLWCQIGVRRSILLNWPKKTDKWRTNIKEQITIKCYIFDCARRDLFGNTLYQSLLLFKQMHDLLMLNWDKGNVSPWDGGKIVKSRLNSTPQPHTRSTPYC